MAKRSKYEMDESQVLGREFFDRGFDLGWAGGWDAAMKEIRNFAISNIGLMKSVKVKKGSHKP